MNEARAGMEKSRRKVEAWLPTMINQHRYFFALWKYIERVYEVYAPTPQQPSEWTTEEPDFNDIIEATKAAALHKGVNITRAAFTLPRWMESTHPLSIAANNQSVLFTYNTPRREVAAATAARLQSSDRILTLELDYWLVEIGTFMLNSRVKRLVCEMSSN